VKARWVIGLAVGIAVTGVAGGVGLVHLVDATSPRSAAPWSSPLATVPPLDERAVAMCEAVVSNGLKSPASAKFSAVTPLLQETSGTVSGDVDSQNGFGALIRNHWECSVLIADGHVVNADLAPLLPN
jgi:hypothetical protein